jgi:hypothetical protein
MKPEFKVGQQVRCISEAWPLQAGAIYTVGEIVNTGNDTVMYTLKGYTPGILWGGYRFEKLFKDEY